MRHLEHLKRSLDQMTFLALLWEEGRQQSTSLIQGNSAQNQRIEMCWLPLPPVRLTDARAYLINFHRSCLQETEVSSMKLVEMKQERSIEFYTRYYIQSLDVPDQHHFQGDTSHHFYIEWQFLPSIPKHSTYMKAMFIAIQPSWAGHMK